MDSYEDFIRAAVLRRYRGRVHFWEVWNEENERFFWKPAPDVDQYARFFTRMRRAILDEDPTAEVAVGGLAGLNASIDIPGVTFLEQLVARRVAFDRVAIHPYSDHSPLVHVQWDGNFDDIGLINARLRRLGRDVPLWVTEWGWSSQTLSEATQASHIAGHSVNSGATIPTSVLRRCSWTATGPRSIRRVFFEATSAPNPRRSSSRAS